MRGAKQLSREEFCGQLRGILAVQFPDETLDRVSVAAALAPVLELAPQEITVHASTPDREVVLRFRGLPFAPWNDGPVYSDAAGTWEELREQNEVELKQLNLQNFRNSLASETRHRYIASNRNAGCNPSFSKMSPAPMSRS